MRSAWTVWACLAVGGCVTADDVPGDTDDADVVTDPCERVGVVCVVAGMKRKAMASRTTMPIQTRMLFMNEFKMSPWASGPLPVYYPSVGSPGGLSNHPASMGCRCHPPLFPDF